MKTIQPLFDNVLIEPIKEKQESGLILPEDPNKEEQMGKVIAVGKGRQMENGKMSDMVVKAGDIVLFKSSSGEKLNKIGPEQFLVNQNYILGIVK